MGFRERLEWVQRAPFEAAVACAGVLTFVTWLVDPRSFERAAIGHTARALLPVWIVLYGIAGLLVLMGLWLLSLRVEVMGLVLLTAAVGVNAFAVAHFAGLSGIASIATFAAVALAATARVDFLIKAFKRHGRWIRSRQ